MKIALLTDLHIDASLDPMMDVDTYGNFNRVMEAINEWQPDHVILAGDLCFRNGNEHVYTVVKEILSGLDIPYDVISGNHDDPTMIAQQFYEGNTLNGGEHYFARSIGGVAFIFLDTTPGKMSDDQWQWFKERLDTTPESDIFIVMHHPPCEAGIRFMDLNHAFQQQDRFIEMLGRYPSQFHIFCGHYHNERTIQNNNMTVYITPSCFFQIKPEPAEFEIEHKISGWRKINLDSSKLMTSVTYLVE